MVVVRDPADSGNLASMETDFWVLWNCRFMLIDDDAFVHLNANCEWLYFKFTPAGIIDFMRIVNES